VPDNQDSSTAGATGVADAPPPRLPLQRLLFGGVYGTVLASSLASALDQDTGESNAGYDALWILVAALAAAAAHGYAHAIAHWSADGKKATAESVRSVLAEWPLVAAVLPTVAALLGSAAGWWGEDGAVSFVLTLNTATLFGWGLLAARSAGQGWASACRVGVVDVMLGLFIVGANALTH
jgi:hypothetical protein